MCNININRIVFVSLINLVTSSTSTSAAALQTTLAFRQNIHKQKNSKHQLHIVSTPDYFNRRISPSKATMSTTTTATTAKLHDSSPRNVLITDQVSSILQNAIQSINIKDGDDDIPKAIQQATYLLNNLSSQARLYSVEESSIHNNNNAVVDNNDDAIDSNANNPKEKSVNDCNCSELAQASISAIESLHSLVHRVNSSRKTSKKSSGYAWKALDMVNSALADECTKKDNLDYSFAVLAMGTTLSMISFDASVIKMIASAIIPSDYNNNLHHVSKRGKKEDADTATSDDDSGLGVVDQRNTYIMARAVVLALLRLAVNDNSKKDTVGSNVGIGSIDLQIVAKIESGFGVGNFNNREEDGNDLAGAVADLVDSVFGQEGGSTDCEGRAKEDITATLSIVANTRPWDNVDVEKLVRVACEMDLWYSAELLCDAAVGSVTFNENKAAMATSFPRELEAETLLREDLGAFQSRSSDSIAHLATGALVDIALDQRLYRRADTFASKYYSFSGPERYAEARFMHACDTISKLLKKRQVQIIDKQIERVDQMVERVTKDLKVASSTNTNGCERKSSFGGDEIEIDSMSEHIRTLTLRRLRASNMHAAASRFATLWQMEYSQDPMQLMQELEKRRETYLQWNDKGCPGEIAGVNLPLPELISQPAVLMSQFRLLEDNAERVGFDCEWHDSINYVALLQLSTMTHCLLIDIPALTMTAEGCNALRETVGKLFSRSTKIKHVIGFSCKDDIKRLRASPSLNSGEHWFPENNLYIEDLRSLILEVSPLMMKAKHFGLSRACEVFLGKQLDKAEQCSDWLARPLSLEQREYAALDGWACAAIYSKMIEKGT